MAEVSRFSSIDGMQNKKVTVCSEYFSIKTQITGLTIDYKNFKASVTLRKFIANI